VAANGERANSFGEVAADLMATYSAVITAPEEERAAGLAHAREALRQRASADGLVEIPMRSTCWRAGRTARL
jgi:hypothetical protein